MTSINYATALPVTEPPESPRGWSALPLLGKAKPSHVAMTIFLYAFFGVFLIWPIVQVVRSGFVRPDGSFTLGYLKLIFQDPSLVRGLVNATGVAVFVTLTTLVVSLPLALLSVRFDFPGRTLLSGLLLVPLVLPPFVGAIGVKLVLARYGPLTLAIQWILHLFGGDPLSEGIDWLGDPRLRIVGIVIVEALHLYPVMVLNLTAALANIDPAMEQAAANIGAGRLTILRKITLPLVRPGLFAGCTLVLIWSFTELGTPLMFNFYDITPVQVFVQSTDVASNPLPFALVVVMLLASALLYVIGKVFLGRGFDAATTKAAVHAAPTRLRGVKALLAMLPFLIVFLAAVLPHTAVILTSLSKTGQWYRSFLPDAFTTSHYGAALVDELAFPSVRNSLLYASIATLLAAGVGLCAAIVIVRSDVPGKWIIDSLAMLPLAVPGLVLAFGYLAISVTFRRLHPDATGVNSSETGLALWKLAFFGGGGGKESAGPLFFLNVQEYPVVLLVLAYTARRLPYIVRSAVAGLQQTPRDLELAASNLGASKGTVLARIVIPLILANLIAGGLLAFAFAMLEVSDSLILAQRASYYPITKAILELSQRLGDGPYIASALGVWAMVLLTLTILSANSLLGKKMGAIFRV
jgi:iron(III) transport system permease protein